MHASKGISAGIFVKWRRERVLAAAYEIIPWPRFPEITLKSLHDHHTLQLAW
jgi:hypothetical protein